jgi:hypothetical protein
MDAPLGMLSDVANAKAFLEARGYLVVKAAGVMTFEKSIVIEASDLRLRAAVDNKNKLAIELFAEAVNSNAVTITQAEDSQNRGVRITARAHFLTGVVDIGGT